MRIHSKIFPFIRHGFMTMTEPGRSKKKGFAYDFMKKEKKNNFHIQCKGYIHGWREGQTCEAMERQWRSVIKHNKYKHMHQCKWGSGHLGLPSQLPQQVPVPHKPLISLKITTSINTWHWGRLYTNVAFKLDTNVKLRMCDLKITKMLLWTLDR